MFACSFVCFQREMLLAVVLSGCEDVCLFVTAPPKKNGLFMVSGNGPA